MNDAEAVDRYFQLQEEIEAAVREGRYAVAASLVSESARLLPSLVRDTVREYSRFDIVESRAVHLGGRVLAAAGDVGTLTTVRDVLIGIPELAAWVKDVDELLADAALGERVIAYVTSHPGTLQSSLKSVVDGAPARIGSICSWLDRLGRLERRRAGRSLALFARGAAAGLA